MKRYTMKINFDKTNDISTAITVAEENPIGEFVRIEDAIRLKDALEMAYNCIRSTAHYDHMKYAHNVQHQIENILDDIDGSKENE